jgi:hypothetical protein
MKYTSADRIRFAERLRAEGFCILQNHIAPSIIDAWRAAFGPLLERHIKRERHLQNRGPGRYSVTLAVAGVFADPRVFEDPDVLGIVENRRRRRFLPTGDGHTRRSLRSGDAVRIGWWWQTAVFGSWAWTAMNC